MTADGSRLSLFARIPKGVQVESRGWTRTEVHGIPSWTSRVRIGEELPTLRLRTPEPTTPSPRIVLQGVDAYYALPWVWFLRDYVGLDAEVSTQHGRDSLSIVLTRDPPAEPPHGTLVVLEPQGDPAWHLLRPANAGRGIFPTGDAPIPYRGPLRLLDGGPLRPLLVETSGRPTGLIQDGAAGTIILGFDPLRALWHDAREDSSAEEAATNGNWIAAVMRLILWISPFIVWKGLWPDDAPPLLYSVDVEAGASYFDAKTGRCSWAATRPRARSPQDTKMENSLGTSMRRLEHHGLIGTFHIDLNAVVDDKDRAVIREAATKHDVAFHLPGIGGHAAWPALIADPLATRRALEEGMKTLSGWAGAPVIGNRYASWKRIPTTHDVVAAVGLGYDSSSLAHPPFHTVPYRMFVSATGDPLDLWEFPCVEVIGAVKAGPRPLRGARTRRRRTRGIAEFIAASARSSSMVVLCDHDMSLGADRGHVHGTWRLDPRGLSRVLRAAARRASSGGLRPMRGSDFHRWWTATRAVLFSFREGADGDGRYLELFLKWSTRSASSDLRSPKVTR